MSIPPAILESLLRFFGTAATPDFSRLLGLLARDPYRAVREELSRSWRVVDLTDNNSDLGFVFALENHVDQPTIRLSVVGPFAAIFGPQGEEIDDPALDSLLVRSGFQRLRKDVLERRVDFWEPEATGCVYEFLFEFDQGLPWAR